VPEDKFALLDQPRRPWIDPDEVKRKFLALSASVHPDRVHGAPDKEKQDAERRFSELNSAYNCLRDPKDRLRHLLELERGAKPDDVQRIPAGLIDLSFEVGGLCKEADAFLRERRAVSSPLLQVQLFERAQEWANKLNGLQRDLNARRDELLKELQQMDESWRTNSPALEPDFGKRLDRLEEIYRLLGYFGRWLEQLQERVVQLSL
jgi:curved DNA-binding protein CbpA